MQTPGDAPIVQVDRLSKRFGTLEAVKAVTFDVAPGEIFGFLGPNGAGKTTTINMLCTLVTPTSGSARVNGFDVMRQRSDVRRSIGLVFQSTTLDEYLSAEQNLRFHGYAYGMPAELRERRINELLEMVELADRRTGSVRLYSGGMKRRLEIARGLLHHPRVLFLDEPTLGLDPQTRRKIWDHLLALRDREGVTIFLTTHYMDEAEHCDRIAVIDHGKIVGLGTPDGLKQDVGGDVITLQADDTAGAAQEIRERYAISSTIVGDAISFQVARGEEFLPDFVRTLSHRIRSIGLRRPTLEDVFLHLTGREIRDEGIDEQQAMVARFARWR